MSRRSHSEVHMVHRIGWLRAAVLSANDGLVSGCLSEAGFRVGQTKLNDRDGVVDRTSAFSVSQPKPASPLPAPNRLFVIAAAAFRLWRILQVEVDAPWAIERTERLRH